MHTHNLNMPDITDIFLYVLSKHFHFDDSIRIAYLELLAKIFFYLSLELVLCIAF